MKFWRKTERRMSEEFGMPISVRYAKWHVGMSDMALVADLSPQELAMFVTRFERVALVSGGVSR